MQGSSLEGQGPTNWNAMIHQEEQEGVWADMHSCLECMLTPKISSDQIWVTGNFRQPLTYPNFTILSSDIFCNPLKS
jgi:hypothetical protein